MAVKRAITEHALLTAIAAVAAESGRGSPPSRDTVREHRAVQLAREHLHTHPADVVTMRDLAVVSGMSMYYLARTFKAETGITPHAYQVQLRVLQAGVRLLRPIPPHRPIQAAPRDHTGRLRTQHAPAPIVSATVGDAYDNALPEWVIGLFKPELIKPRSPWRSAQRVEIATLEYVDWFNHRRLYETCGDIPPADLEAAASSGPDDSTKRVSGHGPIHKEPPSGAATGVFVTLPENVGQLTP